MKRLRGRIITLLICVLILIASSMTLIHADNEVTKFDNFKKVQTYKEGTFKDVKENDWYYDNVVDLYEMKLMIGMTDEFFDTNSYLKVSEAMALAARLNSVYTGDVLPDQNKGKLWYIPYVTYLRDKGIIGRENYEMTDPITRKGFAEIFSKCLPDEAYEEINNVKDGMIPDVSEDNLQKESIYKLFKAGILAGMDDTRSFEPDRLIKRCESGAITSRIVNPKLRIDLGLPKDEEPKVDEDKNKKHRSSGGGGSSEPSYDPSTDYLCIESLTDGTKIWLIERKNENVSGCNLSSATFEWSTDKTTWHDFEFGSNPRDTSEYGTVIKFSNDCAEINAGEKLYVRSKTKLSSLKNIGANRFFQIDNDDDTTNNNIAKVNLSGNIMSMLSPNCEDIDISVNGGEDFFGCFGGLFMMNSSLVSAENLKLPSEKLSKSCYGDLFYDCDSLITAPELPATTLAESCYYEMFGGCTSLITAPELPATTLADFCYCEMFDGCTSLITAPELPATLLANGCYDTMFGYCSSLTSAPTLPALEMEYNCYCAMFQNCTSLVTAPELPATTLDEYCYDYMFYGCTSLVTAPELPVTTLADSCYRGMFADCTSLVEAPELPATTLTEYCYYSMFEGCTNLKVAPILPATTLGDYSYDSMFYGCTNLEKLVVASEDKLTDDNCSAFLNGTTDKLTLLCTKSFLNGVTRDDDTVPVDVNVKYLPEKGDLITLDGQSELYRVMKRDGLNVEVVTYEPATNKPWTLGTLVKGLFSDGNEYPLYSESVIDKWLNGNNVDDYYYSLSDNIKNAIVKKDIKQNAIRITAESPDPDDSSYIGIIYSTHAFVEGFANVGLRNVYMLGILDLFDYFKHDPDDKTVYDSEIASIFETGLYFKDANVDTLDDWYSANHQQVYALLTVDLRKVDYDYFDPLCITSLSNGTKVFLQECNMWGYSYQLPEATYQWSKDLTTWNDFQFNSGNEYSVGVELAQNEKLYIRSKEKLDSLNYKPNLFRRILIDDDENHVLTSHPAVRVNLSGNIMSMLSPTCENIDLSKNNGDDYDGCFLCLFDDNEAIVSAEDLKLPATKLSKNCYNGMFLNCDNLINSPKLPAKTLAESCYSGMFENCISLAEAPELPATSLESQCYFCMFDGCSSLLNAPELPAEILANECYGSLFGGCASLQKITIHFNKDQLNGGYTNCWLDSVPGNALTVYYSSSTFDGETSPVVSGEGTKFPTGTTLVKITP